MSNQQYTQDKFNLSQPIPGKDQQQSDKQKPGNEQQSSNQNSIDMPNDNQRHRDSDCK